MNPFPPCAAEKSTDAKNKIEPNHTQSTQPHSIGLYTEYIWGKEDSHNPCGRLAWAQPVQWSTSTEMWIMKMAWTLFSAQSLPNAAHAQLSVCPSGVEPAWVPSWNPHPVRQAFFNLAFNWESSSPQSTLSQQHCPLPRSCVSPPIHCVILHGY